MRKTSVLPGLVVLISLAACSRLVVPTSQNVDRASKRWPGTTMEELQQGKAYYKENCGSCHALKDPAARTEEQWNQIVPKMARKAKVDEKTENLILKYLVSVSAEWKN